MKYELEKENPWDFLHCQAHAIPYYETTGWQSFAEILSYLHHKGDPLRKASALARRVRHE